MASASVFGVAAAVGAAPVLSEQLEQQPLMEEEEEAHVPVAAAPAAVVAPRLGSVGSGAAGAARPLQLHQQEAPETLEVAASAVRAALHDAGEVLTAVQCVAETFRAIREDASGTAGASGLNEPRVIATMLDEWGRIIGRTDVALTRLQLQLHKLEAEQLECLERIAAQEHYIRRQELELHHMAELRQLLPTLPELRERHELTRQVQQALAEKDAMGRHLDDRDREHTARQREVQDLRRRCSELENQVFQKHDECSSLLAEAAAKRQQVAAKELPEKAQAYAVGPAPHEVGAATPMSDDDEESRSRGPGGSRSRGSREESHSPGRGRSGRRSHRSHRSRRSHEASASEGRRPDGSEDGAASPSDDILKVDSMTPEPGDVQHDTWGQVQAISAMEEGGSAGGGSRAALQPRGELSSYASADSRKVHIHKDSPEEELRGLVHDAKEGKFGTYAHKIPWLEYVFFGLWIAMLLAQYGLTRLWCALGLPEDCADHSDPVKLMNDFHQLLTNGFVIAVLTGVNQADKFMYIYSLWRPYPRGILFLILFFGASPAWSALNYSPFLSKFSITDEMETSYIALSCAVLALVGLLILWHIWIAFWHNSRTGFFVYVASRFCIFGFFSAYVVVSMTHLETDLHFHHYTIGFVVACLAEFDHPLSLLLLAIGTGVFVQGIAAYDADPLVAHGKVRVQFHDASRGLVRSPWISKEAGDFFVRECDVHQ